MTHDDVAARVFKMGREDKSVRYLLRPLISADRLTARPDGRVEGEVRATGNIDVANGATVKALLEGANVTLKGQVEGAVTARDKLTLGRNARLSGDIQVRRLQIDDGATLNGNVRMGDFEQQASGQ